MLNTHLFIPFPDNFFIYNHPSRHNRPPSYNIQRPPKKRPSAKNVQKTHIAMIYFWQDFKYSWECRIHRPFLFHSFTGFEWAFRKYNSLIFRAVFLFNGAPTVRKFEIYFASMSRRYSGADFPMVVISGIKVVERLLRCLLLESKQPCVLIPYIQLCTELFFLSNNLTENQTRILHFSKK